MRTTILQLREHLGSALADQKVCIGVLSLRKSRSNQSLKQDTIGYNLAALRHLQRQNISKKVNEFYEREGFGGEEKVRARLEEGMKKRKRASIKA